MAVTPNVYLFAGAMVGSAAFGYWGVDGIGFMIFQDRRVTFTVADGEVEPNSVRVNRWFNIPVGPLTPEQKDQQGKWFPSKLHGDEKHVVFSHPFTKVVDPIWCTYTEGGVTWKEEHPGPNCPP